MNTSTTPADWKCSKCGAIVPHGKYHVCPRPEFVPFAPQPVIYSEKDKMDRILELLERILNKLESR